MTASASEIEICNSLNPDVNEIIRSSHRWCSVKWGVFKKFANFTEKHLCRFSLVKLSAVFQHRRFPVKFAKFLKAPILKNMIMFYKIHVLQEQLIMGSYKPCTHPHPAEERSHSPTHPAQKRSHSPTPTHTQSKKENTHPQPPTSSQ